MKLRPLTLAVVAVIVFGFSAGVAFSEETFRVATPEELLRALVPGRTILLEPGRYDLSRAYSVRSNYVSWERVHDGPQLMVRGVDGLTVRAERGATILAEPRYAFVMAFVNCRQVLLEGLTLGHTEAGYCIGGVVGLEGCEEIRLEGCALYGSGTVGIEIADSRRVTVAGSAVSDCTAGAVRARDSAHLLFYDVEMLANDSWPLIDLAGCFDVFFQECRVAENYGGALLSVDESSQAVSFAGTAIEYNRTESLVAEWSGPMDLAGALIRDNAFYYDEAELEGQYDDESWSDDYYEEEYEEQYDDEYLSPFEEGEPDN